MVTNGSNEVMLFETGGRVVRYDVDWNAESLSASALSVTGYQAPGGPPYAVYDPTRSSYWVYHDTDPDAIQEITGAGVSKSATRTVFTGDAITHDSASSYGMYGRGCFMDQDRAIAIITDMTVNPYIIRLPS